VSLTQYFAAVLYVFRVDFSTEDRYIA
jgi:hypothetical protein